MPERAGATNPLGVAREERLMIMNGLDHGLWAQLRESYGDVVRGLPDDTFTQYLQKNGIRPAALRIKKSVLLDIILRMNTALDQLLRFRKITPVCA